MSDNKTNILEKCNLIKQVAIRELLDGKTFFIPSYQRGYRWTKTQIYDLCNDLLEYALSPKQESKPKPFYSLQPLIVRANTQEINGETKDVYEVIDGQQRLTSIYILLRAMMEPAGKKDLSSLRIEPYHIFYETRPYDYSFIEELGIKDVCYNDIKDIDIAHIINAYNHIHNWFYNSPKEDPDCAEQTYNRLAPKEYYAPDTVANLLYDLLRNSKETDRQAGNVQFLWYEIDAEKDAIQEFLSENKGKIKLTNTEKIRALFMQRKGDSELSKNRQLSIAKDWELIENTLHRNDFWSFISNDREKEDGRIELIFQYIYDSDKTADKEYDGEDRLFRYYYHKFNEASYDPQTTIDEWGKVMDAFRMLQNWYRNPRVYNLIGLLIKQNDNKATTKTIADIYNDKTVVTTDNFIKQLKSKVCEVVLNDRLIPISTKESESLDFKEGERHISLFYKDKGIPGLLRFLNVNILCQQIEKMLKAVDKPAEQKKGSDMGRSNRDEMCAIYRFPFDALDAFSWDIEHIDSATTNELDKYDEQKLWIEEAKAAFGNILLLNEEFVKKEKLWISASDNAKALAMKDILEQIRKIIGEDETEDRKNWIGNLTLLDSGSNRIYKNKIFAKKREILQGRITEGVFVPVCTQNIFNKTFKKCGKDLLRWDFNDKKAYHSYILQEIDAFKKNYSNQSKSSE